MRTRLFLVAMVACQIALFLQAFGRVSWWDGP
jgi:hypothetical protein